MAFWDDDELLDRAKVMLAESQDGLKARMVAQAMRIQQAAEQQLDAGRPCPEAVRRIADTLTKHQHLIEPVTRLMEESLRAMIASLPEEETPDGG